MRPRHAIGVWLAACALGVAAVSVAGCSRSIDGLDQQVAEMIAKRQRLSLGEQAVNSVQAQLPRNSTPGPLSYNKQPATYNPDAADLPASAAPRKPDAEGNPPSTDATGNTPTNPAQDPAPVELDLPSLLAYAIENAPEYRSEKERLFLATLSLIIERHLWGPRFFNTMSADVSGTPESGDYNTALDLVNDFSVTQRLPSGGSASVSALVNYTNLVHRASTSTADEITQDAAINASINLPLLRGSGKVAREDLIQAERDLVYAARSFERFRRSFFVDISNTYFGLLQQQQRIVNQQQQIEGLERLANEQSELLKAGRIPGFEADDAEAQVLFGRSNLASVQDGYTSSLDSLKLRIGMPVTQPLVIQKASIDVPRPALDPAASVLIGQSARLDLQTTRDQVDDAKRAVHIARDQMRGDLDLDASVGVGTDSDLTADGLNFELGDSDYRVGLAYTLPLDRKIEVAGYRSSLIDLERAERDYRTERDRVALGIRDASRQIERATLQLELQSRNVALAERRLENVKILRRRGEVPPRRLIEAEQDLLNARNSRDQSLADLQTSVLNYLLQTGQMRVDAEGRWLAPGTLEPAAGEGEGQDPENPLNEQPDE